MKMLSAAALSKARLALSMLHMTACCAVLRLFRSPGRVQYARHGQHRTSIPLCLQLQIGAEVSRCCCDVQVGPAKQISLGGDVFPLLQAHVVDGAQSTAGLRKHARLACEWGQHPMTLLLAAGLSVAPC